MFEWTRDVDAAIDRLGELVDVGFADAAVALAERGFAYLEDAYGHVDDSAGQLVDIAERLTDLHLAAIGEAAVDRGEVARRLLGLALGCELDTLRDRLGDYQGPLGEDGWAVLGHAAQEAWAAVPPRGPGDAEPDRYGHRLRLVQVLEALAGDDLEALLEVRARSLAHPYDWVRIVELCAQAGRDDLAVGWGERGLEAFGEGADVRLADVLSDAYVRTGRLADALVLEQRGFRRAPSTARYARVRAVAERAGCWPDVRAEAHRVARERVAAEERDATDAQRRNAWWQPPGSLLVGLHLAEGEVEEAWAAATAHGCSEELWLRMARQRGEEHPEDAIVVHRRRLDRALEPSRNDAYDAVVGILLELAPLYERAGRLGELRSLVAQIRTEYKRRRNLMSRLDRAGL